MNTVADNPLPPKAALSLTEACVHCGNVSRTHFYKVCKREGVAPNIYGTWSVEKLNELCKKPGVWINRKKVAK